MLANVKTKKFKTAPKTTPMGFKLYHWTPLDLLYLLSSFEKNQFHPTLAQLFGPMLTHGHPRLKGHILKGGIDPTK